MPMLHTNTGAMHREKFPEKVPFRLTRMLVNAMEVAGIEGNYRHTCEEVRCASLSVSLSLSNSRLRFLSVGDGHVARE
jgi:hypothetical protein